MKKTQRIFLAVLCIVFVTITALTINSYATEPSMANLAKVQSYKPGQFPDITENEWFGYNKQRVVCKAYELGLMQGKGANFDPNVGVTLAEAITIAARVNNIYNGGGWEFHQSSPWYYAHLEYAVYKGIVQFDTFEDLTRPATRAEMAYIFARALPEDEFTSINKIVPCLMLIPVHPTIAKSLGFTNRVFLLVTMHMALLAQMKRLPERRRQLL